MMTKKGRYSGTPTRWGTGKSKEKQTPYAWIEFNVTHVMNNDEWEPITPITRTVYFYLSEAAYGRSMEKLDGIGFSGSFGPDMDFSHETKTDGVALDCDHDTYKGKDKEDWNIAYGGGDFSHEIPNSDVIDKLNAMYKKRKEAQGADIPF